MVVRFLARCFLAVVVFFLSLAAFDYVFSKVAERSNYQPVEIWHDVLGGTVDADVVALGNSLVTVGFNTEYMDSVLGVRTYALGFSGSQFDRQSYMYSLYRAKNRPPKVVVNFIDHNAMSLTTRVPNRDQFFPLFFNKDFRKVAFPVEHFFLGGEVYSDVAVAWLRNQQVLIRVSQALQAWFQIYHIHPHSLHHRCARLDVFRIGYRGFIPFMGQVSVRECQRWDTNGVCVSSSIQEQSFRRRS